MIKERKDVGTCRGKKENARKGKITIQLEEINQKVLAKEDKTGLPKIMKGNSTNKWGDKTRKHTNNRMQEKTDNFGLKYGKQIKITKMPNE